mmetsp:Transcript_20222/g.60416  ORF Transcript_20222/g.60416 Transcript_20222/m.60416 type:complete len:489 (-) Transcript_20222:378-1844(-)
MTLAPGALGLPFDREVNVDVGGGVDLPQAVCDLHLPCLLDPRDHAVVLRGLALRVLEVLVPLAAVLAVLQVLGHVFQLRVEVRGVGLAGHLRDVRWLQLLPTHGVPVEALVPLSPAEVLGAARPHRQAVVRVGPQQPGDEHLRITLALLRELHAVDALQHLLVGGLRELRAEGRLPGEQLVEEDAQAPPVLRLPVAQPRDHLGRQVVRRAAGGVGLVRDELRQPHVSDLEVAPLIEDQVLGLQVPVDDPPLVKVLEGKDATGDVEEGMPLLPEEALSPVRGKELAAHRGLEKEEEHVPLVVRPVHLDDEGRVGHAQDSLLEGDPLLHALLQDSALAVALQRVGLAAVLVHAELHGTVASRAEQADALHVRQLDPGAVVVATLRILAPRSSGGDAARGVHEEALINTQLLQLVRGPHQNADGAFGDDRYLERRLEVSPEVQRLQAEEVASLQARQRPDEVLVVDAVADAGLAAGDEEDLRNGRRGRRGA